MLLEKIKKIAKSKKILIYKIEEECGLSQGSISHWNEINPSYDKVVSVAKYLGVSVEELADVVQNAEITSELQIFNSNEFGKIRTITKENKTYFVGNDVAKSLGYVETAKAVRTHCKGVSEMDIPTNGGIQKMKVITEGDIYRLVVKSQLPQAEKFESWIYDEVLPSIRKNGGYIAGQETLSDDELMAKALLVAQNKIAERDAIIERQQAKIEADRPKTIFADAVSTSRTSILVGDLAKLICQNGVQIGQKRLFQWLRDNGYLMKYGNSYNMPIQKYLEQGLFEIKESNVQNPDGSVRITRTPKITGKGQVYFINKFLNGKE